jgi:hypothetical protein
MMAESEDEGADISNALLRGENSDSKKDIFSFTDTPSVKRRKTAPNEIDQVDDLDFLSNEKSSKTKLNGSSFKNMGTPLN